MNFIIPQIPTLIIITGIIGSTLITDGTIHTTGIDHITGTLTLGLIALLFIIDHLLNPNHKELKLEGTEEVI